MDAINDFVKNFINLEFDDLPSQTVDAVKTELLDTVGVILAGSSKAGVKELVELALDWGGKQQSSIINFGIKAPAPIAAQVNATMAHALDFDDAHDRAQMHPGIISVPTALAIAEQIGRVSGKEFITGIAIGTDFICRLGLAAHPSAGSLTSGWHPTTLYGSLCAAGITGKLLNLDEGRMINALGIAYHQCSGNSQCVLDGALTKRMGPGFAVNNGITAALMAEKGITGARNILEGKFGMYNQYHLGDYDSKILVENLGKRFEGINVSIKPYPCCRGTHTSIDVTLSLINEYNISTSDIEKVTIFTGEGTYLALCSPIQIKREPRNAVDSQFSIIWAVATAIVKRQISIEDFTEEAIRSKNILEMCKKIDAVIDQDLSRASSLEPVRITIKLRGGQIYSKQFDDALGSPQKPMPLNERIKKFNYCSAYSIRPISKRKSEDVIEFITHLENQVCVEEITQMLN